MDDEHKNSFNDIPTDIPDFEIVFNKKIINILIEKDCNYCRFSINFDDPKIQFISRKAGLNFYDCIVL